MKIKVCGMKDPDNIAELTTLPVNFAGLIFYPKSPRYIAGLNPEVLTILPETIKRVGVFVDEDTDVLLKKIDRYMLDYIQLHGKESVEYCRQVKEKNPFIYIIKAFNVSEAVDFEKSEEYEEICDYFLFDTKTLQHGGSGQKFDWKILDSYQGKVPFFLSGGISWEDAENIKKIQHRKLYGIDLNSRFELEPGIKNRELLREFINKIKL